MKKMLWMLALILPVIALAGGVQRNRQPAEVTLWSSYRNAGLTAGGAFGGHKLPTTAGFHVVAFTYYVTTAAGTATGSMVLRLTDGTNNCDATVDCTTSDVRTTGTKRSTVAGACTFAAGAAISSTIQTACSTAQPAVTNLDVVGYWN